LPLARPLAADRPAGGWPPAGRIIMTPQSPPDYYPFSVPLIMEFTISESNEAIQVLREENKQLKQSKTEN
jgi:hypothetical protein